MVKISYQFRTCWQPFGSRFVRIRPKFINTACFSEEFQFFCLKSRVQLLYLELWRLLVILLKTWERSGVPDQLLWDQFLLLCVNLSHNTFSWKRSTLYTRFVIKPCSSSLISIAIKNVKSSWTCYRSSIRSFLSECLF